MSTEVTPESLRAHATWLNDRGAKESHMALTRWADDLEREQRTLPTVPGWYPGIVVERGGESCTGALLTDEGEWITSELVLGCHHHEVDSRSTTIRWADRNGTTPGQTLWEADSDNPTHTLAWNNLSVVVRDRYERIAAAVLAAHGTPTLTDEDRAEEYQQGWAAGRKAVKPASLVLTPVGEHPELGTRGLLSVVLVDSGIWRSTTGWLVSSEYQGRTQDILADPRPDGAHE